MTTDYGSPTSRWWIQAGCEQGQGICVQIDNMNIDLLGLVGVDVSTMAGAENTLDRVSSALDYVSALRSKIGASQNRLEHTINNLDNIMENTASAESKIRDTDMAKEMVEYSMMNILAQAGQSMLAQANQSSQGILSLFL